MIKVEIIERESDVERGRMYTVGAAVGKCWLWLRCIVRVVFSFLLGVYEGIRDADGDKSLRLVELMFMLVIVVSVVLIVWSVV